MIEPTIISTVLYSDLLLLTEVHIMIFDAFTISAVVVALVVATTVVVLTRFHNTENAKDHC